ncbi:hypothetical protein BSKO_06474 [Bryopsis sp. KO-2023]|nr:hypothetical protein BSKO_06474 [Bryopsis sp. KO-2023]
MRPSADPGLGLIAFAEYGNIPLDRRPLPYSPSVGRAPPRYRSPPKSSPRRHEIPDAECSPRLPPESRHPPPPREQPMYRHWMAWSESRQTVGISDMRWIEQREGGRHLSQTGRHVHVDMARSMSISGEPGAGPGSRAFGNLRPNSVSGEDRGVVKLEPRGVGLGRSGSFKSDMEDVRLEPRTRIVDDSERGAGDGGAMRKKRLGFGDSVYRRTQQSGGSGPGAATPVFSPDPVEESRPHPPPPPKKEREGEAPEPKQEKQQSVERREPIPAVEEGGGGELPKDEISRSKAEKIVQEMDKLDDEIRDFDRRITLAEGVLEDASKTADQLEKKAELSEVDDLDSKSDGIVTSGMESDIGDSESNSVVRLGSDGSRSNEVVEGLKVGSGCCVEANGDGGHIAGDVLRSPPEGTCSEAEMSAGSCDQARVEDSLRNVRKINVFEDERSTEMMAENQKTARSSHSEVWKDFPKVLKEGASQQETKELEFKWDGSRVFPLVKIIQKWKLDQEGKERELAREYVRLVDVFKEKVDEGASCFAEKDYGDDQKRPSRTYRGARSDYEEFKLVQEMIGREELECMVKMPDRLLYPWQGRMWMNKNRLVRDPEADLQASLENSPWTQEEKKIFMDKFIEHPKDFRTIATFLDKRTTSECIDLYYRIQKLDEFAGVRRKQQLKKRRQHAETKRMSSYAHHMLPPSEKRRFSASSSLTRPRTRNPVNPNAPHLRQRGPRLDHAEPGHFPSRIRDADVPWGEKEFVESVRRHRSDVRSVARQFGSNVQMVGNYMLQNRRRLGLDEILAERDKEVVAKKDGLSVILKLPTNRSKGRVGRDEDSVFPVERLMDEKIRMRDLPVRRHSFDDGHLGATNLGSFGMKEENQNQHDSLDHPHHSPERHNPGAMSRSASLSREPSERSADGHSSQRPPLFKPMDEMEVPGAQQAPNLLTSAMETARSGHDGGLSAHNPQTTHQQLLHVPISYLSSPPQQQGGYEHLDSQLYNNVCGLGCLGGVSMPNLLSAAEVCALLSQSLQGLPPPPQQAAPPQSDGNAEMPHRGAMSDMSTAEPSAGSLLRKFQKGRPPTAGTGNPMPSLKSAALRPSLLGSGEMSMQAPLLGQEDRGLGDGQDPRPQLSREDGTAQGAGPGGLNFDTGALSLLLNVLRALPVGAPQLNPIHPEGPLSPFLTAAALQLLCGAGNHQNQIPLPPPGTSQPPPPPPTQSDPSSQRTPQVFPPLFLNPQSNSTNASMVAQAASSVLDRFRFQGLPVQPSQTQQPHTPVGPGWTPNPSGGQDSLRQMYDPHLVNLLLAGVVGQPQLQTAMGGNPGSNQPPPPQVLYQQPGGGSSQPQGGGGLLFQQGAGSSAGPGAGVPYQQLQGSGNGAGGVGTPTDQTDGTRLWHDGSIFGRESAGFGAAGSGSGRLPPEGSGGGGC